MYQHVQRNTFKQPKHWNSYSSAEKKAIIRSSVNFKAKYDETTGKFVKLKSRFVAGGNEQDKSLYDDISAPTATTHSVFLNSSIAAHERRHVKTVDIPGAYLHAKMTGIMVLVNLDRFSTDILCHLRPEYREFVKPDGTLAMQLDKALYGCVESAKQWYDELSSSLKEDGFVPNPKDPCVFNKMVDGVQVTVTVYVDDLLFTSKSLTAIDAAIAFLESKYGTEDQPLTIHEGKVHSFLGMSLDFSKPGRVEIGMPTYLKGVLTGCNVSGVAETPALANLFVIRTTADPLDGERAEEFYSSVAKLLYMSKRARPDIATVVAFLTRRCLSPDEDDWRKLCRCLQYLNGTQHMVLKLSCDDGIRVSAFVDASYAVHDNYRSHTGIASSISSPERTVLEGTNAGPTNSNE